MTKKNNNSGFTLLEMVVAIGLFSIIVTAAIGITISVANAQIKAGNIQDILDNIRFSLELITKELRTGNTYVASSICSPGAEISFINSNGQPRIYYLYGPTKIIMRATETILVADCDGSTAKSSPFTSEEVIVENLSFQVRGATSGPDDGQPWILINLRVKSTSPKYELDSSMNLQTVVTQRLRDLK